MCHRPLGLLWEGACSFAGLLLASFALLGYELVNEFFDFVFGAVDLHDVARWGDFRT